VALYGLILFYALTKEELAGRRPLAKFLAIKLIVMFTFYQSFVFSVLQSHGVIKGGPVALWSHGTALINPQCSNNVLDGDEYR
jgi:hypothetical protein